MSISVKKPQYYCLQVVMIIITSLPAKRAWSLPVFYSCVYLVSMVAYKFETGQINNNRYARGQSNLRMFRGPGMSFLISGWN